MEGHQIRPKYTVFRDGEAVSYKHHYTQIQIKSSRSLHFLKLPKAFETLQKSINHQKQLSQEDFIFGEIKI